MKNKRQISGVDSHAQKERGATPSENAPHGTTNTADSTKPAASELVGGAMIAALSLLAGWLQIGGAT